MDKNSRFHKTDNNRVINEKYIRWIAKMNDCLEVCSKSDGCVAGRSTHKICKVNSPDSYDILNNLFK
jgi:hypothetical protein